MMHLRISNVPFLGISTQQKSKSTKYFSSQMFRLYTGHFH